MRTLLLLLLSEFVDVLCDLLGEFCILHRKLLQDFLVLSAYLNLLAPVSRNHAMLHVASGE